MNVLYFGDVFGRPGREAVRRALLKLVPEYAIDFVVLNGENAAHGRGIKSAMAKNFYQLGVDVITTGNHVWDQKDIIPTLDEDPRIIRPANYPTSAPGKGSTIVSSSRNPALRLAVVQVMGRVFMDPIDCPFQVGEQEIRKLEEEKIPIFVDFHGEASSEKQAFAHFLDGRVAAVVGSHSHVQTADERILPGGTAAITDVGMCGDFDSVIGVKKDISVRKFVTKRPVKYEPAEGPGGYGAVVVEIDPGTGLSKSIKRLRETVIH